MKEEPLASFKLQHQNVAVQECGREEFQEKWHFSEENKNRDKKELVKADVTFLTGAIECVRGKEEENAMSFVHWQTFSFFKEIKWENAEL